MLITLRGQRVNLTFGKEMLKITELPLDSFFVFTDAEKKTFLHTSQTH